MNTQTNLSIQQEENRVIKGHEIYKTGLVEYIQGFRFLVKGKYIVENLGTSTDINDINEDLFVCTCPDFEYRTDTINYCKHIHAVLFSLMDGA